MFMKQYNYKPRSLSTSSQNSQSGSGAAGSPPKDDSGSAAAAAATKSGAASTGPTVSGAIAGRRRSSASDRFAGLNAVKRNSQVDSASAAKKASWAEQKPGSDGILGGMWNNFTKGGK